MNIFHLLQRAGRVYGNLPGVALGADTVHLYGALCERALRMAGALTSRLGLKRGDRVAIIARNVPEYFEIMWGCWAAGLVAVPVNAKLHAREFEYILAHSGRRSASSHMTWRRRSTMPQQVRPDLQRNLRDRQQRLRRPSDALTRGHVAMDRDDVAWLFYTRAPPGGPRARC